VRAPARRPRCAGGGRRRSPWRARHRSSAGTAPSVTPSRSHLALAVPRGEREEAVRLIAEEVEPSARVRSRPAQRAALGAAGMLKRPDDALAPLRPSVDLLETTGARLEHGRSLASLAAALRRANRRARRAARSMRRSRACGPVRLAERADEERRGRGRASRTHRTRRAQRERAAPGAHGGGRREQRRHGAGALRQPRPIFRALPQARPRRPRLADTPRGGPVLTRSSRDTRDDASSPLAASPCTLRTAAR
jgi:hypothetical protein